MERDIINEWKRGRNIVISHEKEEKLILYSALIEETNRKFNISGYKKKDDIIKQLILGSVEPLCDIIVPRGTSFIDLGSGSGVPGIVLGLFFPEISGLLVESNNKKAEFIHSVVETLHLGGLEVVCERAETLAGMQIYRESFDWCFARAFAKLYITIEIGAPFVKPGGCLYVYAGQKSGELHKESLKHCASAGLRIMSHTEMNRIGLSGDGRCFKKESKTPGKYPRKYAVIKREAEKFE